MTNPNLVACPRCGAAGDTLVVRQYCFGSRRGNIRSFNHLCARGSPRYGTFTGAAHRTAKPRTSHKVSTRFYGLSTDVPVYLTVPHRPIYAQKWRIFHPRASKQ